METRTSSEVNSTHRLRLPILNWLPGYQGGWLRFDILAGVTAAAVVIPQAMAYATIAGLPVQVGLYTALVPMLIYALLGTSKPLSVSTTSTIAILTASELATVAAGGSPADILVTASVLALLVGVFLLLASLLRLGFIANFISAPVLTGFKAGIGLVIFIDQVGKVMGFSVPKAGFFETVLLVVAELPSSHPTTFLTGLLTLGILLVLPRALPRLSAPLVAVAAGIAASALFNLGAAGVSLVGEIPSGLPALRLPDLALTSQLGLGALGIALMAFVESIASARAFAEHKDPPADPDRELLALGAANLGGSLFQAMPAGGGTSQTAVNNQAGARSQLAELVSAGFVALTLLFLAPLISLMPQATLGALVMVAALGLVKVGEFRAILRIRWVEFWWAIIALFGVLVLGTLDGIMIAVAASLLALIHEANHPPLYMLGRKTGTDIFRPYHESSGDELFPGLLILRTEGRMTFASAPRLRDKILDLIHSSEPEILALDLSAVPNIEYTALQMLISFEEKLRGAGITLWLVALNPEALKVIQRSVLMKTLGTERMFFNAEQAVEAFQSRSKAADGN
jgi:SulP family sulfate permease